MWIALCVYTDPVDFLHLPGVSGHPAPAVHGQQDWWGRNHHISLPLRSGLLPWPLHLQLDLPLLLRRLLWLDSRCGWMCSNHPLLRLFLSVHHQRFVVWLITCLNFVKVKTIQNLCCRCRCLSLMHPRVRAHTHTQKGGWGVNPGGRQVHTYRVTNTQSSLKG